MNQVESSKLSIIHDNCYKKKWGLLRYIFAIFINLSIFVREYRTRRPDIPHVNKSYVTKPQTSHNDMQN